MTGLQLVCPSCRQRLEESTAGFECARCGRFYPVVAGIPDLRLESDRYLTLEQDRAKALALFEMDGLSFEDLLRAYWRMTPQAPTDVAERYVEVARAGRPRGEAFLDGAGIACEGRRLLDVGCGTGGLLEAAAARGADAVGVDIALRWLVVARRRLEEAGMQVPLVAADGAVLPFPAGSFDTTLSVESVEHAQDQRGLIHSCLASVGEGGICRITVANRFSLATEPTARLWGVGYLPRRFAVKYVSWRRGIRYEHFRPMSVSELRAILGPGSGAEVRPGMLPAPTGQPSRTELMARSIYLRMSRSPQVSRILVHASPFLDIEA